MNTIISYGAKEPQIAYASNFPEWTLARVIAQYGKLYRTISDEGEGLAEVSGKFRHLALLPSDFPAVGDYVLTQENPGNAIIHDVLARNTVIKRIAAGKDPYEQVIGANMDTIFICMSLNENFNVRRIERYLAVAWDSGAMPVIVLTKADLAEDVEENIRLLEEVCVGVDICPVSIKTGEGFSDLQGYLQPGSTIACIGSSGVGKSSLVNYIAGSELLLVNEIREDDGRGKHTSTRRELLRLDNGVLFMDTPGMRELALDDADVERTFSDIEEWAQDCRFRDCSHAHEPGCAVRAAVERGELTRQRLDSYHKLKAESDYNGLTSRQIAQKKLDRMLGPGGMKNFRKALQANPKTQR